MIQDNKFSICQHMICSHHWHFSNSFATESQLHCKIIGCFPSILYFDLIIIYFIIWGVVVAVDSTPSKGLQVMPIRYSHLYHSIDWARPPLRPSQPCLPLPHQIAQAHLSFYLHLPMLRRIQTQSASLIASLPAGS